MAQMNITKKILNFLGITNHTVRNLEYISKIRVIQNEFTLEELKFFYKNYDKIHNDMKLQVNNSYVLCISISYCLLNNENFLNSISNKFLEILFENNTETIKISENIELRLVETINSTKNQRLLRYIKNYKNKLEFSKDFIKYNFDVAYMMTYKGNNQEIIKQIIIKNHNASYKKTLEDYIDTQGCINNVIFYNCLLLNKCKIMFINNIYIDDIINNICNKHILDFLERSEITQRFFYNKIIKNHQENMFSNIEQKEVDFLQTNASHNFMSDITNTENEKSLKRQNNKNKITNNDEEKFKKRNKIQNCSEMHKNLKGNSNQIGSSDTSQRSIKEKIQKFKSYEFSFIYSELIKILDEHKVDSVLLLQEYLLDILQDGFFEEIYFELIQKMYNKLLTYNKNTRIRKNNDKILLLVSKYCKFFENSMIIGHVKNVHPH